MALYDDFEKWVDGVFENEIPNEVVALNFNIYEDGNDCWSSDVVGTSSFDKDGDDWACDETTDFNTRKNPFSWKEKTDWENIAAEVVDIIQRYLEVGRYAEELKGVGGIGTGFVDGDLTLVYVKD